MNRITGNTSDAYRSMQELLANADLETVLEAAVDKYNLQTIIEHLSGVCDCKSAHLSEAWQDDKSAKHWDRVGRRLDVAAREAKDSGI